MLSMSDRQVQTPPIAYVSNLKAGEHGCIFFTSLAEMRKIHFAFVKSGLEDDWGVVYATPAESFDDLKDSMEKHGINVEISGGRKPHISKRRGPV
jgi:hypothetical protein